MPITDKDYFDATVKIVASCYVTNDQPVSDLVDSVHLALRNSFENPPTAEHVPAVPVKKSITDDYIICLEDGKKFKSLKRHIRSHFGLSPKEYREKWGLPPSYPMVAPNYAAQRSKLAKNMGLGKKGRGGK